MRPMNTLGRVSDIGSHRLADWLAVAAACTFIFLASYRVELPGLHYDEIIFFDATQGPYALDNVFVYKSLGPVPLLIMQYVGALKSWLYTPIFRVFAISPATIRLPAILLAAATLLIFYQLMRAKLGAVWATIVLWIMAVDPANVFLTRPDFGMAVLMHFFQAAILALWFSYRDKPELWKAILIFVCLALGCFDKFNFVWLALAFLIATLVCYPDSVKNIWSSPPRFVAWTAVVFVVIGLGTILHFVWALRALLYFPSVGTTAVLLNWSRLLETLSGTAMANLMFESSAGIIGLIPGWLILADGFLALTCLLLPVSKAETREHRKNGIFCLLIGFLIFLQIVITPLAGNPWHYSMIWPLPLLAFAFLTKSLSMQIAGKILGRVAAVLPGCAAVLVFAVNVHNTAAYLSHFRWNHHYSPVWSPEIYSLSDYINKHGWEAKSIISVDWGLHNQIHALAPKKLRERMQERWFFTDLEKQNQEEQIGNLNHLFPAGKIFVVMFAESTNAFLPTSRGRNLPAALAVCPELKSRLVKEFWFWGEKIYELYEVTRQPNGAPESTHS